MFCVCYASKKIPFGHVHLHICIDDPVYNRVVRWNVLFIVNTFDQRCVILGEWFLYCLHFSCKSADHSTLGCTPVTGGLQLTDIQPDIDSDREVEKIHSLFLTEIDQLDQLQGKFFIVFFF